MNFKDILVLGAILFIQEAVSDPAFVIDTRRNLRRTRDDLEKNNLGVFLSNSMNYYSDPNCIHQFYDLKIEYRNSEKWVNTIFTDDLNVNHWGIWSYSTTSEVITNNITHTRINYRDYGYTICGPHYYYVIIDHCSRGPKESDYAPEITKEDAIFTWSDAGDVRQILKQDSVDISWKYERRPKTNITSQYATYTYNKTISKKKIERFQNDSYTSYARVSSEIKLHTRNMYALDEFLDNFRKIDTDRFRFATIKLEHDPEFNTDEAFSYNFEKVVKRIHGYHKKKMSTISSTVQHRYNSSIYKNTPALWQSKQRFSRNETHEMYNSYSIIHTSLSSSCGSNYIEDKIPWSIAPEDSLWCRNTKTMLAFYDFYVLYPGWPPRLMVGKMECTIYAYKHKVEIHFEIGRFIVKIRILSSIFNMIYTRYYVDEIWLESDEDHEKKSYHKIKQSVRFNTTYLNKDRIALTNSNCSGEGGAVIGTMALEYCVLWCDGPSFSDDIKEPVFFEFEDADEVCESHIPYVGEVGPLDLPPEVEFADEPREWTLLELIFIFTFLLLVNTCLIRLFFHLYLRAQMRQLNEKLRNSRILRCLLYPCWKIGALIARTACWQSNMEKLKRKLRRLGNTRVGRFLVYQYVALLPPQPPAEPTFMQQVAGAIRYVTETTLNVIIYVIEGVIYVVWTKRLFMLNPAPPEAPPPRRRRPPSERRGGLRRRQCATPSTSAASTSQEPSTSGVKTSRKKENLPRRPGRAILINPEIPTTSFSIVCERPDRLKKTQRPEQPEQPEQPEKPEKPKKPIPGRAIQFYY